MAMTEAKALSTGLYSLVFVLVTWLQCITYTLPYTYTTLRVHYLHVHYPELPHSARTSPASVPKVIKNSLMNLEEAAQHFDQAAQPRWHEP